MSVRRFCVMCFALVLCLPMVKVHAQSGEGLPVETISADPGTIRDWVYSQGTARSVRREYLLFENPGKVVWIKKWPNGEELKEGDRVKGPAEGESDGELLARQDDREALAELAAANASVIEAQEQIKAAEADLEQAKAQEKTAKADLRRKRQLRKARTISQADLDTAEAAAQEATAGVQAAGARILAAQATVASAKARVNQAELQVERTRIYAPIDGVVANINVQSGQYWSPNFLQTSSEEAALNSVPLVVIDPERFEITLDLPTFDGANVRIGQKAYIITGATLNQGEISGLSEADFEKAAILAEVYSVSPAVNPGGRSVQVKVRTQKGAQGMADGQFVTAWIVTREKADTLVLPRNTLLFRGQSIYAYVVGQDGLAQQRRLTLGIRSLDGVEVLKGINPGERVVTRGRNRLSDGMKVQALNSGGSN